MAISKLSKKCKRFLWEIMASVLHHIGLLCAIKFRNSTDLKLHMGCGDKPKEGWVNIDISLINCDLTIDLRKRVPFSNNSCAIVYSEHFLEHLDYPIQVKSFLKECLRILKPGGIFSVGVPDTEWPVRAYTEGDKSDYFRLAKDKWHPEWCVTRMEHINHHFRLDGKHKFAYDYETLRHVLEICGFTGIKQRKFQEGLDNKDRELGTLYVEAIKPV